jgi:hypothetical protein
VHKISRPRQYIHTTPARYTTNLQGREKALNTDPELGQFGLGHKREAREKKRRKKSNLESSFLHRLALQEGIIVDQRSLVRREKKNFVDKVDLVGKTVNVLLYDLDQFPYS